MININIKFYFKCIFLLNFLFLCSCSGVKEKVGMIKTPPDEFQVYEKKPLVVPPNFELRPPLDKDLTLDKAENEDIIFKNEDNISESLTIEDEVLLISIGEQDIDKNIRQVINDENNISEIDKTLLDKILNFEPILEVKTEESDELDPIAEKKRIQQLKEESKIIEDLKSEINDTETELEDNSEKTKIDNSSDIDVEIKKGNSENTDEDKSFLDKIFDFDLFGSEEKELEKINQRDTTFFNKNKIDSKSFEGSDLNNVSKDVSAVKNNKVEVIVSEKEGSID